MQRTTVGPWGLVLRLRFAVLNTVEANGCLTLTGDGRMKTACLATLVIFATFVLTANEAAAAPPMQMDLIISAGNAALCEHDFSKASATIQINERNDGTTGVVLKVKKAKPNHIYTMWIKLAGVSPLTGAGATPAAGAADIQAIIDNSESDSAAGANAFYTNAAGNGTLHITLDFLLSDGIYPFSQHDGDLSDGLIGSAPFTFRVISHCTDHLQHGLSPGIHEPTFQISL